MVNGSRVRMLEMPDVNHGFAGRDSADAAVAWMADRFAGRPAPSDCGVRQRNHPISLGRKIALKFAD
jgi:hypothetical protein